MSDETWTKVEISFYMPTGFVDRWHVQTDDRWIAIKSAVAKYKKTELTFVNDIHARLCSKPDDNILEKTRCDILSPNDYIP